MASSLLFPNEDVYDGVIVPAARQASVPPGLVKAVIAAESRFLPQAFRSEAHLNDASRGLMQLLFATARDELGYTGTPEGLFNPSVNIPLGIRFLALQRRRVAGGGWPEAVSAYNGGYRPALAFGQRATKPLEICLRRDAQGLCQQLRKVAIGEFANQAYVDTVLGYWEHYRPLDSPAPLPPPPAGGPAPNGCGLVLALLPAAAAGLWLLS